VAHRHPNDVCRAIAALFDAEFGDSFSERGTFRRKKSKGRFYWHHQKHVGDKVVSK
jgi:hypothetical protein